MCSLDCASALWIPESQDGMKQVCSKAIHPRAWRRHELAGAGHQLAMRFECVLAPHGLRRSCCAHVSHGCHRRLPESSEKFCRADVALLRGVVAVINSLPGHAVMAPLWGVREVAMSFRTRASLRPQVLAHEGTERSIALQHALSLSWEPALRSATNVATCRMLGPYSVHSPNLLLVLLQANVAAHLPHMSAQ